MNTFRGGVHPHDFKEPSRDKPIQPLPPPPQAVLPMSQHLGVPCVPTVKKGDTVRKGQVVGEPDPSNPRRFVSALVHASISGKVAAIEPRPTPLSPSVLSVVIESDGQDAWADGLPAESDPATLDGNAIKARIQAAGVVGMGGAGFPTHVKISPPPEKKIDTLILNAAECEPYLTCDYRLMLERPAELVEGLLLLGKALGAEDVWIGTEANKLDAFEVLRKASDGKGIRVEACEVKYPQGAEKQLIYALTGRKVPAGGLPLDVGVVVQNVATAFAVREACRLNKPLIERVVTVTGDGVERPANYLVRLGTPFRALLDASGLCEGARKIIAGGPMMGIAQGGLDVPVVKGTSGILVLREAEPVEWRACISCGRCVDACPMGLMPNEISIACEARDLDMMAAVNILDCFECGCCTYVCPARRPIVHWVKWGKAELGKRKAQQQKQKAS
ncbi:MAG TPA: electron transport complex subunit RsxC [Planctomycetota bacterium]|nr:electron transport complex subunit RsxC [Planctomycetota bacterium]